MGYGFTDDERKADLVLVNTCAIRELRRAARAGQRMGALTHTKRANPNQIICLCGWTAPGGACGQKVQESYRQVDLPLWTPRPVALPGAAVALPGHRKAGLWRHTDEAGSIAEGIPVVRQGAA